MGAARTGRAVTTVALALAATVLLGETTADATAPSPCNPYYPLPAGGSWTYREGPLGGKPRVEKLVTVKSIEGQGARRTAVLEQSVRTPGAPGLAAGQARTVVHCDRGRIGLTVRGAAQGREGTSTSTGTVTAEIPGLPPADELVPGYEWKSKSTIRARDGELHTETIGSRTSRVAGRESVTVPAGRYPSALKIIAVETLEQRGPVRSAQQELVEWYAQGIGLVKRETRVRSGSSAATSVEVLVATNLGASEN